MAWGKFTEASQLAQKEGKAVAVVLFPETVRKAEDLNNTDVGTDAANDTFRALKSFCVIVKGSEAALLERVPLGRGWKDGRTPKVVRDGIQQAGQGLPIVVIVDAGYQTLLGKADGNEMLKKEGRKTIRDAKRKHRALAKAKAKKA